jgi:hypothetical protein
MKLETLVGKMRISKATYSDGTQVIYDDTFDQQEALTLKEGKGTERRLKESEIFSGENILKQLEKAKGQEYGFIKSRVDYWKNMYDTGNIMELNFGVSSASRCNPGQPWEERTKDIPMQGELETIQQDYTGAQYHKSHQIKVQNYTDVRADKYTELPAVVFPLASDDDMLLVWISGRKEWVAFKHHSWTEGIGYTDEIEYGPYALDSHCKKALATAYNKDIAGDISKMSPEELSKSDK